MKISTRKNRKIRIKKDLIMPSGEPFLDIIYHKLVAKNYEKYEDFKKDNYDFFKAGMFKWMSNNNIDFNLYSDYFYVCFYSRFIAFKQEIYVANLLMQQYNFLKVRKCGYIYDKFFHIDLIANFKDSQILNPPAKTLLIQVKPKKVNLKDKERSKILKFAEKKGIPILAFRDKNKWVFEILTEEKDKNLDLNDYLKQINQG